MLHSDRTSGASFVERHGLWSREQHDAAAEVERRIETEKLEVVRFSFPDQHGVLRGKEVVAGEVPALMRGGCSITTTLLAKDTSHRTVFPVFTPGGGFAMPEMEGGGDFLMIPDPLSFRTLPWAPGTGWMLCDIYFDDGKPVPFSTRHLCRSVLERLSESGLDLLAGIEIELHIFRIVDPRLSPDEIAWPAQAPRVSLLHQGFQYLTETRFDQVDPVLEILRGDLLALGLPLRSLELELGPSQVELTFGVEEGLGAADTMVLLRSAVKQICRRHGYAASFMCRPRMPNVMSSGWHLHQSLRDRKTGENALRTAEAGAVFSKVARHYLGGLLAHARAASAFTTPTINGYKRYRPNSLAPDRAVWGRDNRGVMIRVLGGGDAPGTRVENRVGEPAANPYLYIASQVASGMDGLNRELDPGPSADTPYEADAPLLPRHLPEALEALRRSDLFRDAFGSAFVEYFVRIKDAEIARFFAEVTDWEEREYFDLF